MEAFCQLLVEGFLEFHSAPFIERDLDAA
jgi:hypothetical protein